MDLASVAADDTAELCLAFFGFREHTTSSQTNLKLCPKLEQISPKYLLLYLVFKDQTTTRPVW